MWEWPNLDVRKTHLGLSGVSQPPDPNFGHFCSTPGTPNWWKTVPNLMQYYQGASLIPMISLPTSPTPTPIPMCHFFAQFTWLSLTFHWLSPTLSYYKASLMCITVKVILFCIFSWVQVDFCWLKNLTFLDLCKIFDFISWLFLTNILFFWLSLTFLFYRGSHSTRITFNHFWGRGWMTTILHKLFWQEDLKTQVRLESILTIHWTGC